MSTFNSQTNKFFAVTDTNPPIYIDSVKLVHEVKSHPIIYNSWLRRDQFLIFAAWDAVATALLPDFPMMDNDDKAIIKKKLCLRWRWMRGTLRRDMSRNKLRCHIHLKWMQEMQFLVPLLLKKDKNNSHKDKSEQGPRNRPTTPAPNVVTSTTATSSFTRSVSRSSSPGIITSRLHLQDPASTTQYQYMPEDDPNETMVKTFISAFNSEVFTSSNDPDVHFIFTLLHVYRNLRADQKAMLQSQIFHILK